MIRTFLAIEIPGSLHPVLGELLGVLKRVLPEIRWVAEKNLHLTLKFFGNITEEQLRSIQDGLKDLGPETAPLSLSLKGLGVFPHLKAPRVIWAGFEGEVKRLIMLQREIDSRLGPLGFPREDRPFHPHLTLGRNRERRGRKNFIKITGLPEGFATEGFQVNELVLLRSDLSPKGPAYTPIWSLALEGRRRETL
jgi:2'-5' RNA ligase